MSDLGDEEYYPGGGFLYETPLRIGQLVISSSHDYMLNLHLIHAEMHELGFDDEEIELFDEDCGPMGDVDGAAGTVQYINMSAAANIEAEIADIKQRFMDSGLGSRQGDLTLGDTTDAIASLAAKFSLDDLAAKRGVDKLIVDEYPAPAIQAVAVESGLMPPRPPLIQDHEGPMVAILVQKFRSHTPFRLRSGRKWGPLLDRHLPNGASIGGEEHFDDEEFQRMSDAVLESETSSTLPSLYADEDVSARSNSRPKGGLVMAVMSNGEMHNIGSHNYIISSDITIPLELSASHAALAELFSAVAGEGLACATGSHVLHQMVSAVLSASIERAIRRGKVEVEIANDDFRVTSFFGSVDYLSFDVTTTAGVWYKLKGKRKVVALSKYDVGCIIMHSTRGGVAQAFACGIACALAVEHQSWYGQPDLRSLTDDLRLQYQISNIVDRMSQRTVSKLAELSYHAVMAECVADAMGVDPFAEGVSYRQKADVLIKAINALEKQPWYAFPPVPVSPITLLPTEPMGVTVGDLDIMVPSRTMSKEMLSGRIMSGNTEALLKNFPADGRFSYEEVASSCRYLQTHLLRSEGLTHRGPLHESDENYPEHHLWDLASETYGQSSIAQFAEIRADLVRHIDQNPPGHPDMWNPCLLYKGKVLCYYRVRDPVTDARGYRVDWFAISTFDVIGSTNISTRDGEPMYLWPRQRLRSQEMELAGMLPRRLKLTLYAMLGMSRSTSADYASIVMAWQKLALTAVASTWASGANFITCRHLSSSLSAPAPPFDSMAKKFKPPKTVACIVYYESLLKALNQWTERDMYKARAAILDLPRSFSQLEAYWQVWVPTDLADVEKHFTDCVIALHSEAKDMDDTFSIRVSDLQLQYELITRSVITYSDIRESVRSSCTLETGGKFGWSVFGSMAAAHALTLEGSPKNFDRSFSRGGKARNLVSHLTVRHSGRINSRGELEKGTVAEMIMKEGVDNYLSTLQPSARFFYSSRPYFMNHPKNGELKDREISITNPDARIMLNDAEYICGEYGRTTRIDMLKRPDKDAFFYKISTDALLSGGVIQASDASRFAAMMSNVAVGITCKTLAAIGGSAHLASSAAVYTRLASRKMVLDTSVMREIDKRLSQDRSAAETAQLNQVKRWISKMPKIGTHGADKLVWYCTAAHTGQGMSHVGMSIEHGGALLISVSAAKHAQIIISGKQARVNGIPLVTSDDSTIVTGMENCESNDIFSRHERQRACHMFLKVQRACRQIALRAVSVMPNNSKEKASGTAGEFNSQDNGIGVSCPILGFREMICQMVRPSSPCLITDYLDAHAYGRTIAMSGMGLAVGCMGQRLKIDAIEQRWKLRAQELKFLEDCGMIPESLLKGSTLEEIVTSATSLLPDPLRAALMQMAYEYHSERENVNLNTRDMAFTVLTHVQVSMKSQHRRAIRVLTSKIEGLRKEGLENQALMIEQSLTDTLASARTRNAGRIAQRVRTRYVTPGPCLGQTFSKAPILETTLSWIDYVASRLRTTVPSPEIKELSQTYGVKVIAIKPSRLRFPEPSTRTKSKRTHARKPVFILSCYGTTPFGRHVVSRSGATVIDRYGPEERRKMTLYSATRAYRLIPEHTVYGGRLVLSWYHHTSCVLATRAASEYVSMEYSIQEYWGTMDEESIQYLRETESEYDDTPVLALNYASGGRAHFHAIWKGRDYSCSMDFDPDTHARFTHYFGLARGGVQVIMALQGWTRERTWYGAGPTAEEIISFQNEPPKTYPNSDMERAWLKVEKETFTRVPLAATVDDRQTEKILYMVDPKITRKCPQRWLPHTRAKFLACMATGGYWYSSISGVCVRAYMKGHYGTETTWSGPVLGWRLSKMPEPEYYWHPPDHGTVKTLSVIGGIDNDSDISVLNPKEYADTHCYLDREGMHVITEVHVLPEGKRNIDLIRKANGGDLLFNASQGKALFIDCALPVLGPVDVAQDRDSCLDELWRLTHETEFSAYDL